MYPFGRFLSLTFRERNAPRLGVFDTHVLPMRCLPWDMDMFLEMNNGRTLTLFDLGRFGLSARVGLMEAVRRNGWGFVVAGSSVRYRARITALQRFDIHTRLVGWDDKFFYLEQAMWRGETCCNHALLRTGVTEKGRLAPTVNVAEAMGLEPTSPALPAWVQAWTEADAHRPWPPEV